ncbi:hypothetical protein AAKU58_000598 [Oxalobacteraceae bacterium GrIS 1.18]
MGGKRAQFCSDFEDCSPATAGKTGRKWDFSPPIAADSLLPRRLLVHPRTIYSRKNSNVSNHHYGDCVALLAVSPPPNALYKTVKSSASACCEANCVSLSSASLARACKTGV